MVVNPKKVSTLRDAKNKKELHDILLNNTAAEDKDRHHILRAMKHLESTCTQNNSSVRLDSG